MKPEILVMVISWGEGGRMYCVRPGMTRGRALELHVRSAIAYRPSETNEPVVPHGIYIFDVLWDDDTLPTASLRKQPRGTAEREALILEQLVSNGLLAWRDATEGPRLPSSPRLAPADFAHAAL